MKKLDLWRRRSSAVTPSHDVLPTEVTAADAGEHADHAPHARPAAGRDDHEDTVPAAFYRSEG